MSKILKGLLNEANPHNYDSDWDYQDAVAKSGKSRSSYRSQEDDTSDADIAYSKKMYQLSQKQKRDADHDRLATGTNEEQLDELSNNKLGQYKKAAASDASKADNQGNYNRANKRFSGIVKATKKQFANDEKKSNMDEADENPLDPFKHVNPRVNNPKILGTQNKAKSAYYPPSKPPVKKLDKPLPESLEDNLPSKSLQALMQAKQQNEKQRMAELEQWEQDFKQNTVSKFTAREPNLRQRATSTPMVAMPGEGFYDLKAKLVQLDKAIEKQVILDKMVQRLDKKGLMTPNIEAGVDTSMLIRDGARDSYVELNKKLDKALEYVKDRLLTNKAAYAKPKAIDEEQLDELSCWSGYHRVAGTKAGFPGSCAKNKTNEEGLAEEQHSCPHCGGEMVSEELMNEKKDACYYKVKSRYKVWPSAYASGALVKCRNKGASNWGNGGKKNESSILEGIEQTDEDLHKWFKEKWVRFGPDGKIRGACARGDDSEGKPKCLPKSKAQNLGKKGRASAASRKRREDPNPERHGKAINVATKKKTSESSILQGISETKGLPMPGSYEQEYGPFKKKGGYRIMTLTSEQEELEEKWSDKYKRSIDCSHPKGFSQRAHCQGKKKK